MSSEFRKKFMGAQAARLLALISPLQASRLRSQCRFQEFRSA
jgi:hypothetical protein